MFYRLPRGTRRELTAPARTDRWHWLSWSYPKPSEGSIDSPQLRSRQTCWFLYLWSFPPSWFPFTSSIRPFVQVFVHMIIIVCAFFFSPRPLSDSKSGIFEYNHNYEYIHRGLPSRLRLWKSNLLHLNDFTRRIFFHPPAASSQGTAQFSNSQPIPKGNATTLTE